MPLLLALIATLILGACGGGGSTPATFTLMFDAPGGSGFADGQENGVRFAPIVNRDFTFAMGIAVSGQVTDGTGTPLADVDVSFKLLSSSPDVDSDVTNGSGDYNVTLSEGTWVAVLEPDNPALGTRTVTGLLVAAPGPVVLNFQLPAMEAVSGTVFDSVGTGLDSAEIEFTGTQSGAKVIVVCNAAGFYTADLRPDTYEAIVTPVNAAASTHLKQRFMNIVVTGVQTQDFTLTQGITVSGTVFDNLGLAMTENAKIDVVLPSGSDFFAPDQQESDGNGDYAIGPVPSGSVNFRLDPPGDSGFPLQLFPRVITGPANQVESFTLVMGFVFNGRILQDDGLTSEENVEVKPVPTAAGSPAADDDDTNGSGVFEISLFPGTYRVEITPDPANAQLPEVRTITISGPTTLNFALQRGVMVSGTVFQPDGITEAADILVEIPSAIGASDKTDGAGAYSFLAPPGTHSIDLIAKDGPFEDIVLDPVTGVIVALPGPMALNITMVVATSGSTVVQGTVFAPDGVTPVGGVEVEARDKSNELLGRTVADAAGDYTLVIR